MTDRLPDHLIFLGLSDHLDKAVVLMTSEKSVVIDGNIYACLTQEALKKTADSLMEKYKRKPGAQQIQFGYVLDDMFFFEDAKKLVISGLLPGDVELTREELEPLREVAECFVYMHESALNRMSVDDAYVKMKDKVVFFQGRLPDASSDKIAFSCLDRSDKNGNKYKSAKAYLTYEHAARKNTGNMPISTCKLSFLRDFIGAVAVEPDEHYWIEFIRK